MPLRFSRSVYLSISLGVAYGVALRILMGFDPDWLSGANVQFLEGVVSVSFFVIVPIVIGFITIYFGNPERGSSLMYAFFVPWVAIGSFLLATMVLLLEGSVCVVLALPGFLLLSSLGGLAAAWITRLRLTRTGTLCSVLALPLLISPIERTIPVEPFTETVVNRLEISAPPNVVWAEITDVGLISKDELAFGLTRLLGVPQPLEAHMERTEHGWVRNTRWEQGISFREIITDSREGESLLWRFDFPPSAVPEGVLDEHVQIGGRHFELLDGGYTLAPGPDGTTYLEIRTSYRVTARPAIYSRYWARLIMSDFHRVILDLIRDRSERV
jgi:hypothetical protein